MSKNMRFASAAFIVAMGGFYAPPSLSTANAASGEVAATAICARCHDTSSLRAPVRQDREGAPPAFASIAQNPKMTPGALRKLLLLPHGDMNNVTLTEREIDGLIAYIRGFDTQGNSKP